MHFLERPICFLCREPAVNCKCQVSSGRELLIPLVYGSEPSNQEEGLQLWATYLSRHPATPEFDIVRMTADLHGKGVFPALDRNADRFRLLVLAYAMQDFPELGSVNIPDRNRAAVHGLNKLLHGRWSKMTNFDILMILNAANRPDVELDIQLDDVDNICGLLTMLLQCNHMISKARNFCLELYPPVYKTSFTQPVYNLKQPVAKASYKGLSLSAYEALMSALLQGEGMSEASVVAAVCIQTNVTIEEVVAWKFGDMRPETERGHYTTMKQHASRIGQEKDVILLRLPNTITCPVGRIALMTTMQMGLGSQAAQSRIMSLITGGRAKDIYLIQSPDDPCKPMTPNKMKKQLVQALAKINVKVEAFEVQSLLHATYKNCMQKSCNFKEGRKCEVCKKPASTKCGKCKEVGYCSRECQARDWKAGHKQVCGM